MGFKVADDTLALMRQIAESGELQALTAERSWKEIERALMERQPQVFIKVLHDCGALNALMRELEQRAHTLAALRRAAEHQQPLAVRWACLLRGLEPAAIKALNQRFKAPRECQELALLVGEFAGQADNALQLVPANLLEILQKFDVYRRPQRFEDFIAACEMATCEAYPQGDYLRGAANAARAVDVKPLLEAGLTGQGLGEALK